MSGSYEDVEPLRDEKAQRLINLVLVLRSNPRGFTKAEIFQKIQGYQQSDNPETISTMFERDKADLLKAGIQLDVYQANAYSEDEFRYRILDEKSLLPEITFTDAENQALSAAISIWRTTLHKDAAAQAQLKFEGLGQLLTPEIPAIEMKGNQHLEQLLLGIQSRKVVEFEYLKPNDGSAMKRKLQPWGVLNRNGQWFLYGFDLDRSADRVFNLNRIQGNVLLRGSAGAYEIPADVDFSNLFKPHFSQDSATTVKLRVVSGAGIYWRNLSNDPAVIASDVNEFECVISNLSTEIPKLAAQAPEVIVLAPADVRKRVKDLLLGVTE